ncbi:hypothetical protein O1E46_RS20850 [Enterobacter hormaechei]
MKRFMGTPGPWEWWTSNSFLRLSSKTTGRDGDVIDSFGMSDGATSLSVKADDMNLISAAPDLLEALQEMTAIVKKNSYPQPDKPSSNYARAEWAESIIRKALGEE